MLHSRMKRVSGMIQDNLAEIIDQRLENPLIPPFVTVHSVKVSKDLRKAEVNVTFLQDEDESTIETAMTELKNAARFIRGELGRRITLKYLPELRFHYNPSTHYAADLDKLFHRIEDEDRKSMPDLDGEA